MDKRPKGYWNDFENVKNILLPECQKLDRMLLGYEIRKIKGLYDAMPRHGGIVEVGLRLGFNPTVQYKTLSGNIVKSIFEVIIDNFLFLNDIKFEYENKIIVDRNHLYDFKIQDIFIEVWGYIGKVYNSKRKEKEKIYKENNLKLISLEPSLFKNYKLPYINKKLILLMKKHNIKQNNFYKDDLYKLIFFYSYNKEKIIEEIKQECVKNGFETMPSRAWWFESSFRKRIKFFEGKITLNELAKLLGLKSIEKPKKYWKNFENLKNELLPICKQLNCFPTQRQLSELKRTDIHNSISKYHGGFIQVKQKLNY